MRFIRKLAVVCMVAAFLMVFTPTSAKAECCYFNPFAIPFLVAGAVVGTAAAVTTGILGLPFYGYPYYYGPAYYGSSYYYGPRYYYDPWYYAPGPFYYGYPYYYGSWFYGPRYRYYGHRPYWNRPGWWGPRHNRYHDYAGGGNRYEGRMGPGGPRVQRGPAPPSAPSRAGGMGNRYSVR